MKGGATNMSAVKKSISLPEESFAQLEWIRINVLHCVSDVPLSQLIQMAIGLAYFQYSKGE